MTVERAFVLGSPELYREWGYTAMSRGRWENRLYVVAPDDLERQEIAPADRRLPTARESLDRGLSTSRAHTVGIDTGLLHAVRGTATGVLKKRLRALDRSADDEAVIAASKAHSDAVCELDRLGRELREAQRRRSQLLGSRPSILRVRSWHRHHVTLGANAVERHLLRDRMEERQEVVRGLARRVEALRAERAGRELPSRVERQLIEDELHRRASMERHVSPELIHEPSGAPRRSPPDQRVVF